MIEIAIAATHIAEGHYDRFDPPPSQVACPVCQRQAYLWTLENFGQGFFDDLNRHAVKVRQSHLN